MSDHFDPNTGQYGFKITKAGDFAYTDGKSISYTISQNMPFGSMMVFSTVSGESRVAKPCVSASDNVIGPILRGPSDDYDNPETATTARAHSIARGGHVGVISTTAVQAGEKVYVNTDGSGTVSNVNTGAEPSIPMTFFETAPAGVVIISIG